jgi:hypothetical protein
MTKKLRNEIIEMLERMEERIAIWSAKKYNKTVGFDELIEKLKKVKVV